MKQKIHIATFDFFLIYNHFSFLLLLYYYYYVIIVIITIAVIFISGTSNSSGSSSTSSSITIIIIVSISSSSRSINISVLLHELSSIFDFLIYYLLFYMNLPRHSFQRSIVETNLYSFLCYPWHRTFWKSFLPVSVLRNLYLYAL